MFPFPTNGIGRFDPMTPDDNYIMTTLFPFPTNGIRLSDVCGIQQGCLTVTVSIPYKRDTAFRQRGTRIDTAYVAAFPFPTNGIALSDLTELVLDAQVATEFRFPTNGIRLSDRVHLLAKFPAPVVSIPYKREGAFRQRLSRCQVPSQ